MLRTQLVSIKQASKLFNFPMHKLYALVRERKCPFIELETPSGNKQVKINTQTFSDWLDQLAKEQQAI